MKRKKKVIVEDHEPRQVPEKRIRNENYILIMARTSAMRSVRNCAHLEASSLSWDSPSAPKLCMARSTTSRAIDGTTNYTKGKETLDDELFGDNYLCNSNFLQCPFGFALIDLGRESNKMRFSGHIAYLQRGTQDKESRTFDFGTGFCNVRDDRP